MHISRRVRVRAIALLATGLASPALAHGTQAAGSSPQTQTPPQTIPGLEGFSLPSSRPTATPTPAPTLAPVPSASPSPVVPAPAATPDPAPTRRPQPRATPTPTPTPTPTLKITPTPTAVATPAPPARAEPASLPPPVVTPTSTPSPIPSATPTATTSPSPAPAASSAPGWGWWLAGGSIVALGVALVALARRRRGTDRDAAAVDLPVADPLPVVADAPVAAEPQRAAPAMPQPAAADGRARLTLALAPRRAGLNLLSATVEAELVVRNAGTAPAAAIRVGARLVGASAGQGGEVGPLFAQPVGRPVTPPFALAPGEERRVRLVVALPRGEIVPLAAGGRAMFVPVVAVNALYDGGGAGEGQSARAFAVGVERVDSAKLAPFWLDQPARMHEQLGVRPYGTVMER